MCTRLFEGDFAALKQLYEVGARDIEHVCGFLCGELSGRWHDAHGVSGGHVVEDAHEEVKGTTRHGDDLAGILDLEVHDVVLVLEVAGEGTGECEH
jgi:hypothetical protein